jgi:hypothetical protein
VAILAARLVGDGLGQRPVHLASINHRSIPSAAESRGAAIGVSESAVYGMSWHVLACSRGNDVRRTHRGNCSLAVSSYKWTHNVAGADPAVSASRAPVTAPLAGRDAFPLVNGTVRQLVGDGHPSDRAAAHVTEGRLLPGPRRSSRIAGALRGMPGEKTGGTPAGPPLLPRRHILPSNGLTRAGRPKPADLSSRAVPSAGGGRPKNVDYSSGVSRHV